MVRPMPESTPRRPRAAIAGYALAVVLIAVLSALQAPYEYGNGNQIFQIPKVLQLMNPDLFRNDALVHSLRNYPSAAYPAIAWLTETLGAELETVYFALWAFQRVALVGLVMLLASRFVEGFSGRVFVTLVACTAQWAVRRTPIGGEHLFASHMTHTELAFLLQAGALAAWLYRREIVAGALIGTAVYLNAMTTVHAAGFLVLLWLMADDRFSRRYLWAAVAMIAVAAPFAVSVHQAMSGSAGAAGATERFWALLRIRRGAHYFLNPLHFAALTSIAVVMGLLARVSSARPNLRRMMIAGVVYVAAMFVISYLGVHVASSKLAVLFHPLRGDKMLFLTLVLAVPIIIWQRATESEELEAGTVLLPAIAAAFMMGYTPPAVAFVVLPVLLALVLLIGENATILHIDARYVSLGLLGGLGAGLLVLPDATLWAGALLLGAAAGAVLLTRHSPRIVLLAILTLLALGMMARSTGLAHGQFDWYRAGQDEQFAAVAQWAEQQTTTNARFITPTWKEGWRCLSRRTTLAQYRDLSAMHWDVGFEGPLWERLEALNGAVHYSSDLARDLREGYVSLDRADLASAMERFEIDYAVMPGDWPPGQEMSPVYANEGYRVFTVEELQRGTEGEKD